MSQTLQIMKMGEQIADLKDQITKWKEDYICLENLKDNQIKELKKEIDYAKEHCLFSDCERVKRLEKQLQQMSNCLNCAFWKDKKYNVCREIKKLGKICCTFWKFKELSE